MSIIAYQYEADRYCVSCAQARFQFRCDHDSAVLSGQEGPEVTTPVEDRRPGVRYCDADPMLNEHGIPCDPYPEDTEGETISTVSSYDDWCNDDPSGCILACGTCYRDIRTHLPSEHGYCDCGDGCIEGECDACSEGADDDYYEPEDREPSFGCSCVHCEAADRYVLGMDDTVSVEQLPLPSGDVCALCGMIEPECPHGFEPMQTFTAGVLTQFVEQSDEYLRRECARTYGSRFCQQFGTWNTGPSFTGGPASSYFCERHPDHTGQHVRVSNLDGIVRWA